MTLLFLLFGCDPASEAACADAAATRGVLEIGTGEEAFSPVADGDEVQVAYGPQGGQHVWGGLHAVGIVGALLDFGDDTEPVVDFEVLEGGARIGGYTGVPRFFTPDGAAFELVGETLILDWPEDGEGFDGREVVLRAHLVDACGRELSAERAVTLVE